MRHTMECEECGAMLCNNPECGCALEHDEAVYGGIIHREDEE